MQFGMVGLGRMGANMARRLMRGGHSCVAYDIDEASIAALEAEGARGARTQDELVAMLEGPRVIWLMLPVALVDAAIDALAPKLAAGDVIVDGGNTHYPHDLRRAEQLGSRGIRYVDCGVSGGVHGLERGYCLMAGGAAEAIDDLAPLFDVLAPGVDAAPRLPGAERLGSAERGWLHCGSPGAGHFVKMVHNGIEYALMAAYAEGFNLLTHANVGAEERSADAETTPLAQPEHFRFDLDVAGIAEVWRRGSVIGSWLLDLSAGALAADPSLGRFAGRVSDSGEGRWTVQAAVEAGVPVHVLSAALFDRFTSRGEGDFGNKLLSAMRHAFGGHVEKS